MKSIFAMLAVVMALVANGLTFAADSDQVDFSQIDAEQRQQQLVNMSEPEAFSDDICWIAPEWRDS